MNKNKKILVLVPAPTASGGIKNYFSVLKKEFSLDVEYFIRGARNWPYRNPINEIFRSIYDLLRFIIKISSNRYNIVHTNTSLDSLGLMRDGMFILISKIFNKKVIVFFRGWNLEYEKILEKKYLKLFKYIFFKADSIVVLSQKFKSKIHLWGYKKKIFVESTLVDSNLIKGVSKKKIINKFNNNKLINILFLARIEKEKGIFEAIDTFALLREKYSNLNLLIAGEGIEEYRVKQYVIKKAIPNIEFLGYVSGEEKIKAFQNSHLYFFPSYTEGMPNSVLEAMAFGLPIITRPVGGLTDFFQNYEHGLMTESKDPQDFFLLFQKLLDNKELLSEIAINNFEYSIKNFLSTVVVKRIEVIYSSILSD